jgi:hypothetical protein
MTINLVQTTQTAGTTSATLASRLGRGFVTFPYCVNVLDFAGVKNDGTGDSTAGIIAALTQAWGGYIWPNNNTGRTDSGGQSTAYKNIPVYFPTGIYNITGPLGIYGVSGALIFGDGPSSSILKWTGSMTNGRLTDTGDIASGSFTRMWQTNGFRGSTIRDICFDMGVSSGNIGTAGAICFDWNWDGGTSSGANNIDVNTSVLRLINVHCRNSYIGFSGANLSWGPATGSPMPPNFNDTFFGNNECDSVTLINFTADNCYHGLAAFNQNAIGYSCYGGSFTNCNRAILPNTASQVYWGCYFHNNTSSSIDICNAACHVAGCESNDLNFFQAHQSTHVLTGNRINSSASQPTPPRIAFFASSLVSVNNCNSDGVFAGNNTVFVEIRDSKLTASDPFDATLSGLPSGFNMSCQEWLLPTGLFSQRPTVPHQGFEMNFTDSTTTTFGATISGTGTAGSTIVRGRYNGSNWTVCGAIS